MIKSLENPPNQPSKFRIKNWVEMNNDSCGTYNTNSQIKFKATILNSSLYCCSDAHILFKGTTAIANTAAAVSNINDRGKSYI